MMTNEVKITVTAQDKTKGVFNGVKSGLASVAKGAAVMGAAVAVGALAAVKGASDLSETINKSSVIFGKNAKDIESWAEQASWNLGLSKQQAMEAASGFGDMFLQLGFASNKATDMSMSVVKLSADLGSFNNLPTADVSERIAAAFRGEYDSLQQLIPNINAARVEKEALAETGKKNAKALTAEEKAAAVLAIVTKDGARAQGDFAKTSDGLANSLKIVKASLMDARDNIGKLIEPAAKRALQWFVKEGLPAIENFVYTISKDKDLKKSIKGLGDALKGITGKDFAGTLDAIADALPGIVDGMSDAADAVGEFYDAIVAVNDVIGKEARGGMFDEKGPLGKATTWVKKMWRDIKTSFVEGHTAVIDDVKRWVGRVADWIKKLPGRAKNALSSLKDKIGGEVKEAQDKATDKAKALVTRVVDWFKSLPGKAKNALSSLASKVGTEVEQTKDRVLNKVKDMVNRFMERMRELVRRAREWAGRVKGSITDKFAGAKDWLYSKGKAVIDGLLDGLKDKFAKVKTWVSGIAKWIKDHKGPISLDRQLLKPAGTALMGGLLEGLKFGFGGVGDFVYKAGTSIKDIIGQIKNSFLGDWSGKIGSLKGGGNRLLNAIRNMFGVGGGTYPGHGERGMAKSWDFMARGRLGDAIAAFTKKFARQLGVLYIIWNRRIWNIQRASEGWRRYTRSNPHTDHVHVSLMDRGGLLRPGGIAANLSGQPERVLSPNQTRSFDRLVRVMSHGGGTTIVNHYHFDRYIGNRDELRREINTANRQNRMTAILR